MYIGLCDNHAVYAHHPEFLDKPIVYSLRPLSDHNFLSDHNIESLGYSFLAGSFPRITSDYKMDNWKIAILGDVGAGKTALAVQVCATKSLCTIYTTTLFSPISSLLWIALLVSDL